MELGKDQIVIHTSQINILDTINSLKEIPETTTSWGTHVYEENRLPRGADVPSLEKFKFRLDGALTNLI